MTNNVTSVDKLWEAACCRFPVLSSEEQRAAIVLLRELSKGEPVAIAQVARALGTPIEPAGALVKDSRLSPFVHASKADQIEGFWGLSVAPTHHHIAVKGRMLWTWCAYDTLFMPELLGETAAIESRDPETDQMLRLTVSPTSIETADPTGIVVSIVPPQAWDVTSAARVMASACHSIFFFASRASAERWQAKHPETVLLSLDEAFALGRRQNARLFATELARHRTA